MYKSELKTSNVIVNEKYKKVVPDLLKIVHQAKEVCGTPGISFAITKDGELVTKGGVGLADVENYTLMSNQTLLRIASISKSLTSVAVGECNCIFLFLRGMRRV